MARIFIDDDNLKIAKKRLENLLESSKNFELQALSYLALVNDRMQDRRAKAREYFKKAKKLSKNYKPLLELKLNGVKNKFSSIADRLLPYS